MTGEARMDTVVDDLHYLELMQLAARIKARKISPLEVTRANSIASSPWTARLAATSM